MAYKKNTARVGCIAMLINVTGGLFPEFQLIGREPSPIAHRRNEHFHPNGFLAVIVHKVICPFEIVFLRTPEIMRKKISGNILVFFFIVSTVGEQTAGILLCGHVHVLYGTDHGGLSILIIFLVIDMGILIQRAGRVHVFLHEQVPLLLQDRIHSEMLQVEQLLQFRNRDLLREGWLRGKDQENEK